jgi:hypothetical protein
MSERVRVAAAQVFSGEPDLVARSRGPFVRPQRPSQAAGKEPLTEPVRTGLDSAAGTVDGERRSCESMVDGSGQVVSREAIRRFLDVA